MTKHFLSRFCAYSAGGQPEAVWQGDWIARKGIGLACLATPAGNLQVFNTHTCANYGHTFETHDYVQGRWCCLCAPCSRVQVTLDQISLHNH